MSPRIRISLVVYGLMLSALSIGMAIGTLFDTPTAAIPYLAFVAGMTASIVAFLLNPERID